ncbi:hypothetical protein H0H92_003002 [Tricholoma furcatifolium]|nr:hypothetical protein H0H92_003002 [Tricholoma furcatifolium]
MHNAGRSASRGAVFQAPNLPPPAFVSAALLIVNAILMFHRSRNILINGGTFTVHTHVETNGSEYSNSLLHLMHASAPGAAYDSQQYPRCPRGPHTTAAFNAIEKWMFSEAGEKPILWLHGQSRTFTSSIAQHLSKQCAKRGELAASFFFSSEQPKCSSVNHLITTIALQLSLSIPNFYSGIVEVMEDDPFIMNRPLPIQVERLILRPLKGITAKGPFLVVIDALGRCKGEENQREFLTQVLRIVNLLRNPLRFVITSSFAPQGALDNLVNHRIMGQQLDQKFFFPTM